jgi:hypothetical protein
MKGNEVKILSIRVAELVVRRVGLFITGKRDAVKLILANSAVGGWVSEFKRLRL